MWRTRWFLWGLNKTLNKRPSRAKRGSLFGHVLPNISGTRWDTETLNIPNERYCLQLSNGVPNFTLALVVLMIYHRKKVFAFLQNIVTFFQRLYLQDYYSYRDLKHVISKLQARSFIWWVLLFCILSSSGDISLNVTEMYFPLWLFSSFLPTRKSRYAPRLSLYLWN